MSQRLLSLDAFRGATIAGMLLVNNPGDWGHVHPPLLHAEWHGWTVTDWIFPFFVFISGIAMTMSLGRRAALGDDRRTLVLTTMKRGLLIAAIGLLLNAIPSFNLETLRIPGVLQRLGLLTVLVAPLAVYAGWRAQALTGLLLLALYTLLMQCVPVTGPDGVLRTGSLLPGEDTGAALDRWLMNGHLWAKSKTWDPEGLLSTLPAVASQIAGLLVGHGLAARRSPADTAAWLFVAGLLALLAGEVLGAASMPINKSLWTPAYVFAMAGWALLVFGTCFWLLDGQPSAAARARAARWAAPLVHYGMNALFLFVLAAVVAKAMAFFQPGGLSLKGHAYGAVQALGLSPVNSSLAFALAFVLAFWAVAYVLFKKQWFLKV